MGRGTGNCKRKQEAEDFRLSLVPDFLNTFCSKFIDLPLFYIKLYESNIQRGTSGQVYSPHTKGVTWVISREAWGGK